MKKNKFLKLASGLLVLCLLTTCVISTTFAKYVTEDSASDTARVAKWGVEVGVQAGDLATFYAADTSVTDEDGNAIANTVVSSDSDNLIAPGTKGKLATATITGVPEVAANVEREATLVLTGWEIGTTPEYYCPLKITVNKKIQGVDGNQTFYGMDYASVDLFIAAVEAYLDANINYVPNTDLAEEYTISWAWDIEGTDGKQTDEKDTALGDKAVGSDIKIEFTFAITVTQID